VWCAGPDRNSLRLHRIGISRTRSITSDRVQQESRGGGADPGAASKLSSTPRSNGLNGSTIVGCWSPSATSRPPKPKINIMLPRTISIWQHDSQPKASGRPGAVHEAGTIPLTISVETVPAVSTETVKQGRSEGQPSFLRIGFAELSLS